MPWSNSYLRRAGTAPRLGATLFGVLNCVLGGLQLCSGLALGGCAVLYPEVAAPIKPVPPAQTVTPPPPVDLFYIAVRGATIPNRTLDGRRWDELGTGAPDPYAVIYINAEELFRTTVQSDSLEPTWPDSPKLNYTIAKGSKLKVEIWDDNAVNPEPICVQEVKNARAEAQETGEIELYCPGGTRITLDFAPARARWGSGLYYELRGDSVGITRVLRYSPASRAGLVGGEDVLSIGGKPVKGMSENEVKSAINGGVATGVTLSVRAGGETRNVEIKDGPVYWLDGMM
jgi:C2 domain